MSRLETALIVAVVASAALADGSALERNFVTPPHEAKPHTWYHLMNGNVTKEGITADFEALAKIGIGGVQMFDAGCNIPPGPVSFNTPEWFDMFNHAAKEAQRLGLEICIPNCSGWSSSGGPWNMPSNGMKFVTWREAKAKGPSRFRAKLPRDTDDHGFYEDIAVLAFPTPAAELSGDPKARAEISDLKSKTFACRGGTRRDTFVATPAQVVAKGAVRNITGSLAKDGTLDWDVPEGDWTIVRIGYKCNGRCNHPASDHGRGLEVDKLSAEAMDYHFNQYVGVLCKTLGPLAGNVRTGFNNILVDSYEVASQNWTQRFGETFEKRMGYSLVPYLPVFAGRIVDSVDVTERFLEDFRRVVADLFAENYAGALAKKCHDCGLMLSLEPYGNSPSDDLQYGEYADIPMGEFWSDAGSSFSVGERNARFPAYVAHVWGKKYAATESFTGNPSNAGRWRVTPFVIKAQGDRVFTRGVNRIIYHRFTHQPWVKPAYMPGMTMGRWGMHFDRTQTWWDFGGGWIAYQSRCQAMLQAGTFVADVLFFCGEQAPNSGDRAGGPTKVDMSLPHGYDWDICPTDALMKLRVEDGRVVVPGGVRYAMLVLPPQETMSAKVLAKVDELVSAGAKVCGARKPVRAPGLVGYPKADADIAAKAAKVWAKGVMECPPAEALARLCIAPDFTASGVPTEGGNGVTYIHRGGDGADWYFVAMPNRKPVSFEASFREAGRVPEIWDAETGRVADAGAWRVEQGRTVVRLGFDVSGSAFVVFRRPAAGDHVASVRAETRPFAEPPKRDKIEIVKGEYGVFSAGKSIDITERLRKAERDGVIDVEIGNVFAGGDPLFKTPKTAHITYRVNGKERQAVVAESSRFTVPEDAAMALAPAPYEVEADGKGGATVWAAEPLAAELTFASGAKKSVKAEVPRPQVVGGPWQVSFPHAFAPNALAEGADETVAFERLTDWAEHPLDGIKYFSGTATYAKRVTVDAAMLAAVAGGGRLMLDLGIVKHVAQVTVNGKDYPALWKPPFRIDVTDALGAKPAALDLRIRVANLWANRLIGDDRLCAPDCEWKGKRSHGVKEIGVKSIPQWVKEGKKSPTGRMTFTTWKHWDKDDELQPSGLLGPVRILAVVPAK